MGKSRSAPVTITEGPRKKRPSGPPKPRRDLHKVRAKWFQARAAWPRREAPAAHLVWERSATFGAMKAAPGTARWSSIGPTNIGGRLTCLAAHPTNPDRIWAGAAGGGVWYSKNAGRTWTAQWHDQDTLNVGALAIDPTRPGTLYCGTGEANLSADSYAGVGLYRTRNGGRTWRLLAPCGTTGLPSRIGVIAIDPFDPDHLLLGGVGFGTTSDFGGLYVSRDGGVTWQRQVFVSPYNYWCHAIVFHPTTRGLIYATVTEEGIKSGIYRSDDGGASWTQLTKGLPVTARFGRTSLAISPSRPSILYALAADAGSEDADRVLGVFRTTNGGGSWTNVAGAHFRLEGQMSYGNTIAVHPTDPDTVLCGGVDLRRTTDGGKTWKRATAWNADRGHRSYAHADHHALLMPAGRPDRVYDANDGGLDVSEDAGARWTNRSAGLAVTMYYDMDVAPSNPNAFGGGAQDNGTVVTTTGRADDHAEILGGDGGWIVFDPNEAGHLYASYYNLNLYRFRDGDCLGVSPPADEDEQGSVWMAFIDMAPGRPDVVYTGSTRVWRTLNDGVKWRAVSAPLDGSPITAIEVATRDSRRVYVGTENGGIFRSTDGGATWSPDLSGAMVPGFTITRLAASPADATIVYATLANFDRSHVFRSGDGGTTWADVDQRGLPNVPHHAIAIPAHSPKTLYVCNDVGVFVSRDDGATWANLSRNLPHVMVVDLVYHEASRTLYAATYGRSLWKMKG